MEKFSDFRILNVEKNICPGSIYFNKRTLHNQGRIASYFELYFAKNITKELSPYLYGNVQESSYDRLFEDFIMRKIGAMGECMYEEKFYNEKAENVDYNGFKLDHEENKKMLKFTITCKLLNVYYSKLVHLYSINVAEAKLEKLMYEASLYWKVDDIFDYIITRGEKITEEPTPEPKQQEGGIEFVQPYKLNKKKEEPKFKDDYNYNRNKEIALFQTILDQTLFCDSNSSLKGRLLSQFRSNYDRFDRLNYDLNNPNFNVLNIIKDSMLKISMVKMDLEVKDKVLRSLQKIMDDEAFKEEKTFINIQSVLEYNGRRPNKTCEQLIENYSKTHGYVGKVYHGFRDRDGFRKSAEDILKDYKEGFISCSKDIRVAKNFAMGYDDDGYSTQFGGVIEMIIKEEDVAIDIEQILKDEHDKNSLLYGRLYDAYIREHEVLLKLPVITYNVLYRDEVNKIIQDIEMKEKIKKEEA